jgi:hypothetical protein
MRYQFLLGTWIFSALLISSLLSSCARPKYEVSPLTIKGHSGGEVVGKVGPAENFPCSLSFDRSHYCLSWKWEKKPTESDYGSFLFKIYRENLADGTPVGVDQKVMPTVVLWMPSMGHGSTPVEVQRLDVGTYRASEVFFVMPGEWEIKFQILAGSAIEEDEVVDEIIF